MIKVGRSYSFFIILLSFIGCGNQNSPTFNSQATPSTLQLTVNSLIFSSVPKGAGKKSCTMDCELVFTAGINSTVISDQKIPSIPIHCDAAGTPETGQGFEATLTIDPNDPQIKINGNLEGSCTPTGGTFLSLYSDSIPFSVQACPDDKTCTADLEMTNVVDSLDRSGLLDFLANLSCTALEFIISQCEFSEGSEPSLTCNLVGLALSLANCSDGVGENCGNGICDTGEDDFNNVATFCFDDCACKGNLAKGGDCECETKEECFSVCSDNRSTRCGPVSLPDNFNDIHCTCTHCNNGVYEPELGEGCDVSDPNGTAECFATEGAACDGTTCECFIGGPTCGNEIVEADKGEECDTGFLHPFEPGTCPSGFVCDPNNCKCVTCGNRIVDNGENGTVDAGEECDIGGFIDTTDQCGPITNNLVCKQCLCTACGNGTVDNGVNGTIDAKEECDVNGDLAHWTFACSNLGFCPDNCRDCACGGLPSCGVCPPPQTQGDPVLTCVDGCCVPMSVP